MPNLKGIFEVTMILIKTSKGDITVELDFEGTPNTAKNFQDYIESGFYDGTIVHRVINNFMIQGGGFNKDMEQKEGTDTIKNEAKTGGANKRGTLAMARTNEPHSASSQFFINVGDNDFLDFKSETEQGFGYCVFGKVIDGMDVVDAIKEVKTGQSGFHGDVPAEAIVIESATVLEPALETA